MTHPRWPFTYSLIGVLILALALCAWPHPVDPAITAAIAWKRDTLPGILKRASADSQQAADSLRVARERATAAQAALGVGGRTLMALRTQNAAQLDSAKSARDTIQRLIAQRDSADSAYFREARAYQALMSSYLSSWDRGDVFSGGLSSATTHLDKVVKAKTPSHWHLGATVGPTVSEKGLSLMGVTVGVSYTP